MNPTRILLNEERFSLLVFWMTEREKIRLAKERGDQRDTWTRDAILHTWRFCNVNRCDDRETKWIFKHVIEAHADSPVLWFNLCIARFLNWSPTLSRIGYFDKWDRDFFVAVIADMQFLKQKIYTGAYMIPAGPSGTLKHEYLADAVFSKLWLLGTEITGQLPRLSSVGKRCADWDHFLRKAPLMGDFLRNQIITDMRYTHHLKDAPDWETFVLPGPGTQRGLNRLYMLPLVSKWTSEEASVILQKLRIRIVSLRPDWREMMRDINNLSNCMCEFDKYCRVLGGEGKPRARYAPYVEPVQA